MKRLLLFLFGIVEALPLLNAQHSAVASGGNANNINGSVSYSIGQPFIESILSTQGKITAGVQQPYEIFTLSGTTEVVQLDIAVFPNPTSDDLILSIKDESFGSYRYALYHTSGWLVSAERVATAKTTIQLTDWPAAVYFLRVYCNEQEVKAFQIIKTD